jgi:hypothetical protein
LSYAFHFRLLADAVFQEEVDSGFTSFRFVTPTLNGDVGMDKRDHELFRQQGHLWRASAPEERALVHGMIDETSVC